MSERGKAGAERSHHGAHAKVAISLHDVKKTYTDGEVAVHALQGITFDVKEGEFLSFMGPSGSGKSTLMHILGCLDYPTSGAVMLRGRDITTFSQSDLSQIRGREIGFIFQSFNLLPNLTAIENVALPMFFQQIPYDKRTARAKELLLRVGMGHRLNHFPNQLSGGEQQRVAIARALSMDPKIVLADEPTGNIDSKTGKEIMALFQKLHEVEKKTMIIITHDHEVARHADKIIRIRDGKII